LSRALVLLIWLRIAGGWAIFWRSGRGSLVALLGKFTVLALFLGSAIGWTRAVWYAFASDPSEPWRVWLRSVVAEAARLAPLPLLLFLVLTGILSVFDKPFRFSANEVNFLCAGPFSRRQLVNYKIGAALSVLFPASFLVAGPLGAAVSGMIPVFVGSLLLLSFIRLVSLVSALLGSMLGLDGSRGPRRLAITLACVCAILTFLWYRYGIRVEDPIEIYRQVERSAGVRAATTPLRWFVGAILARRLWPDLVEWSSLCLLVNALLVAAVHVLDSRLEARPQADDQRALAPDGGRSVRRRAPWRLPLLARCEGAGPIAWRQSINLVRRPEHIRTAFTLFGMFTFVLYMLTRSMTGILFLPTLDGHREINPTGAWVCGAIAIVLPMFIAASLPFDFRGDMGQIDVMKALPVEPLVVAAGELMVPVVIAAGMQWLAMGIVAIGLKSVPAGLWVAALFVPPVSVVLIAIENLPALWFPLRPTPGTKPEPFEQFGHMMLHPLLKNLGHCAVVVATLVVSAAAYFLCGQRAGAALAAAWLTLAASGCGLVAIVAHVFDRFDVTRDVSA
jgi:hypothetical protein